MLRGSLDDFSVEDVLWLIDRTKKTGRLAIDRPVGRGSLFFRDGLLYCAESELLREPFEAQLVRTGLVSPSQLQEARSRRASPDTAVARALVSEDFVHSEQLRSAFEARLSDGVFELMRREFGEFAWEADEKAEPDVDASLSVRQIMEAASSRRARLQEIQALIASEQTVPTISRAPSAELAAITITADQWRLLALIDGSANVETIARRARLTDFTALTLLHDLASRGLLDVSPGTVSGLDEESGARSPAPTTTATRPFRIVLMCTANRIRSPMAESFLRSSLGDLPATVHSVGVEARGDERVIPEAAEAALELGADLDEHLSRPLAAEDLRDADLILGFETRHVRRAIRDGNAPPERTFTLPQFVKCLERAETPAGADPVARARAAVELADAQRPGNSSKERDIEIVDPLGGPKSAYRNTALRIRELCNRAARGLFEAPSA